MSKLTSKISRAKTRVKKIAHDEMKSKVKARVRRARAVTSVLALAICAGLWGCQATPNRAQSLTFDTCTFNILAGAASNAVPVEIATQAMAVETGGSETLTPTSTVSPTTTISVPVNKAGASQSVGSILGDAVASLFKGGDGKQVDGGTVEGGECADGACEGGVCADGTCNE